MKIEEMKANGIRGIRLLSKRSLLQKKLKYGQRIGTMPAPYLKRLLKHCQIQLLRKGNCQRFNSLNAVQNLRLLSPPRNQ